MHGEHYAIMIAGFLIAMVSSLSSLLATVALFYYKLQYSFNYRLILYLLATNAFSFMFTLQFPLVWYQARSQGGSGVRTHLPARVPLHTVTIR